MEETYCNLPRRTRTETDGQTGVKVREGRKITYEFVTSFHYLYKGDESQTVVSVFCYHVFLYYLCLVTRKGHL